MKVAVGFAVGIATTILVRYAVPALFIARVRYVDHWNATH